MSVRFDGHRYRDCKWCGGGGCLQCPVEADKAYAAAFPGGPQPIATFRLDSASDMERARATIGPEALQTHFGEGGGGMASFLAALAKSEASA